MTTICSHAFDGSGIAEANMPTSLVTIEEYAFYNHQMKSVTLPSTTKSVGKCAFYLVYEQWSATLASLTLNEGLTSIGMAAFGGSLLTEVDLPSTVTTLDAYAFYDGGKGRPGNVILHTKNKAQLTETDTFKPNGEGHEVVLDEDAEPSAVVKMWRLYNPYTGEHFYTSNADEYDACERAGWRKEGMAWLTPTSSNTPVHRLYNPYAGDHHFTTSEKERDTLVNLGWRSEGVGWYSDDEQGEAVYRLYNPYATTGTHHLTVSKAEYDALLTYGWRQEGISWWGCAE